MQWAAAHVPVDDPYGVLNLLLSLREAGAYEQAATLAGRVAAHAALDNRGGVARLLDSLQRAGADEQAATLAARLPAPVCSSSSLCRTAPRISSVSDRKPTAPRPRHGAGKTWTYRLFPDRAPAPKPKR